VRAILLLLAVTAQAAWAGAAATSVLERAEAAFDALSFDEAVTLYQQSLKAPGTRAQRLEAWKGLALSRAYMGDGPEATDAFMKLLALDPDATVDGKLGPRISRPLEDARRATRKKKVAPALTRARNGALQASFTDASGMAHELRMRWRKPGDKAFQLAAGTVERTLTVKTAPDVDLEAYLQVVDEWEGVLYEVGSEEAPKELLAVVRTGTAVPRAVADAVEDARVKSGAAPRKTAVPSLDEEDAPPTWPWWLAGAAVVVGGGAAAAWYFTRPAELSMPAADRTGTLP
jgi:hypothetical protein